MKNLVSTALVLALASQTAACVIIEDDDDELTSTWLDVKWNLRSGTAAAACRPDTTSASLYACPGDCPDVNEAYLDAFTCSAGSGAVPRGGDPSKALPPGRYTIWMELSSGSQVYAKSFSQQVTLDVGYASSATFDIQVDHGFFDVAWVLMRGAAAVSCPPGTKVGMITTPVNGTFPADDSQWPCTDGVGRTNPIKFNAQGYVGKLDVSDTNAASRDENLRPFAFGNEAQNLGSWVIEVR